MNAAIESAIESCRMDIAEVCTRFGVLRLELFGSAATGSFDPQRSDLDFLVEFDQDNRITPFEKYFGLKEALESLFSRPVDLVMAGASSNPHFQKSVDASRRLVYAA